MIGLVFCSSNCELCGDMSRRLISAAFLASKWEWVREARKRVLSRPAPAVRAISASEAMLLQSLLAELHALWADRLGEPATTWKIRRMKTRWGVCDYARRRITYSLMLAGRPAKVPRGVPIPAERQQGIVDFLMAWIERENGQ